MDITSVFGTDVPGSSPGGGTGIDEARHDMMQHKAVMV